MKNKIIGIFVCMLLIGVIGTAFADWEVGESYKMHYPQLPDPFGNAVDFYRDTYVLADDWQCIETGHINDIHFWISWYDDEPKPIPFIEISIWSNEPIGPGGYSIPKDLLWQRTFNQTQFIVAGPWQGAQGWLMPWGEEYPELHFLYWQINIKNISNPFLQTEGEIYWLAIRLGVDYEFTIGWKTTTDHFMDYAVWCHPEPYYNWSPIYPVLDFAFVITGELLIPNLDCDGSLIWTDVTPGDIVNGSFEVENIGDPLSMLDWEIESWPEWGEWTFDPNGGDDLTPDTGPVTVNVEVVAPLGPDEEFTGEVKIVNIENSSDFCIITVDLDLHLPDLDCIGELSWIDVKPGSLVTGEIYVLNDGDPHSPLDWEIIEWPTWGDWSFAPSHGFDLTPEDPAITVQVFVEAPDEENTEFEGEVTIVNSEDPDDTCTIPVSLKTPCESPFLQLLEILMHRFPVLWRILSSLI